MGSQLDSHQCKKRLNCGTQVGRWTVPPLKWNGSLCHFSPIHNYALAFAFWWPTEYTNWPKDKMNNRPVFLCWFFLLWLPVLQAKISSRNFTFCSNLSETQNSCCVSADNILTFNLHYAFSLISNENKFEKKVMWRLIVIYIISLVCVSCCAPSFDRVVVKRVGS